MKIFYIYIIIINLVAAVICAVDKHQARIGGRRISEKTLITLSVLGGAIGMGMYLTMLKIRHKTRHKRFMVGLPIIIAIHILAIIYYLY